MSTDEPRLSDDDVIDRTARRFISALRSVEQDGDLEAMVSVFSDDAELHRLDGRGPRIGAEGARVFWNQYRGQFATIASTFTHVTETDTRVVLEWTASGTLSGARAFDYAGVSVLDIDGDLLCGFRTYYDTAALLETPPARAETSGAADPGR